MQWIDIVTAFVAALLSRSSAALFSAQTTSRVRPTANMVHNGRFCVNGSRRTQALELTNAHKRACVRTTGDSPLTIFIVHMVSASIIDAHLLLKPTSALSLCAWFVRWSRVSGQICLEAQDAYCKAIETGITQVYFFLNNLLHVARNVKYRLLRQIYDLPWMNCLYFYSVCWEMPELWHFEDICGIFKTPSTRFRAFLITSSKRALTFRFAKQESNSWYAYSV